MFLRSYISICVPDEYKHDFFISMNGINLSRGKITSIAFIFIEMIQLIIYLCMKGESILKKPYIYYGIMYCLMILFMTIFLFLFLRLDKNISAYHKHIKLIGTLYAAMILLWCQGITLLDQKSSGQIIVYSIAIIAVAVTPIYTPLNLLFIYIFVQFIFLLLLPHFQHSSNLIFSNYINSTAFLIISWFISWMRYKQQTGEFMNKRIIKEKNDELKRLNEELENVNKKLEKLSRTDGLTGVYNRSVFNQHIVEEWERCKQEEVPFSLIMIDIDYFKAFNDNYGHQEGDHCLKQVAQTINSCVTRSDIVSRYGGEEFAIIISGLSSKKTFKIAEHMRLKVTELAISHNYSLVSDHITISLGVNTVIPSDSLSLNEFIHKADMALYQAKEFRNKTVSAE